MAHPTQIRFQIFEDKKNGKRIKGTGSHETWTEADVELNMLKKKDLCIKRVNVKV